jgi:purine nucleosidase/pyrimidine-specific ribonucleoside hydrolase
MNKYIIDTDIGDDIDDAFALLYAMEMGMDILGVTTVFKNTTERARMVKKLFTLYGRGYENVPVYAGYGNALASKLDTGSHTCQYTEDIDAYSATSENRDDAIDFIIDSCKKYGKELTLISIGPFTNVAKVIEKDPDILKTIGGIVIMGGAYFKQYADWNVSCDPEAAEVMFDSLENIVCLGADVTHKLSIGEKNDKTILAYSGKNQAASYVSLLYRLWKEDKGGKIGVLHDPLVIHYAIDNTVCELEAAPVKVITEGYARGMTLNVKAYTKAYMNPAYSGARMNEHLLAREVDRERVIEGFMKIFKE